LLIVRQVNGELLDKLEFVGRKLRGKEDQPWGGLQVVEMSARAARKEANDL